CGIEKTKDKMVGRGVFLDVARFKGVDCLDDGYGITSEDLDKTAKAQNVSFKRGDYIIVRTGQMERCLKAGNWDGYPGDDAPGFAFETLEFVARTELAALASDTWGCEVRPNNTEGGINQPWHWITIPIMGMTMGEIFYLTDPAAVCDDDKVYEFMFVAPAIPITGAVGSPTNPLAIKKKSLQECRYGEEIGCHTFGRRMSKAAYARAVPDHAQARHRDAGKLRFVA